jgi:anhydro-N-acetylmuramic acid kinase
MGKLRTAIGLMSGTSMDGIDAAVLVTDGEGRTRAGGGLSIPYREGTRARLRAAVAAAASAPDAAAARAAGREVEAELTGLHAEAVRALLAQAGVLPAAVDVVGFHGQTVLHRPRHGLTIQLGDGAALAADLGIAVVHDFRSADVAAGGEGAPFAPAYHRALAAALGVFPVVVVNIGGVANVTWLAAGADPIAFDTGPGNALIDDWIRQATGAAYDAGGALASSGAADGAVLARLIDHPYFAAPPPKSLDRNDFSSMELAGMSPADGAATLVAFTAASIAAAQRHFPAPPARWIVTGGGRRNGAIMAALRAQVAAPVAAAEEVGWRGDELEAEAFAYLAVRALDGLPLSWPTTTGVPRPMPGGVISRP